MRIHQVPALILAPLLLCGAAFAQNTLGYAFVAPGGWTQGGATVRDYQIGGGVERLFERGVGAGAELAGAIPGVGRATDSVGIFSLNGYYHFLRDRSLDPFATAGYSLVFRDFTSNGFNYGGGFNYWFREDLALKLELRDQTWIQGRAPRSHVWGVRIGLTFR